MSTNLMNDISKIYLEQVSVASRARNAVADDRLDAEQEKTNASMNRLRQQSNSNRVARVDAAAAARKVESDVKNSSAYGPQRPKPGTVTGRRIEEPKPTGSKPTGYRVEETEIDEAQKPNDGNLANNYPPYDKITRGDVIAGRLGKDEMGGKKKKKDKKLREGFSNWRQDLSEVIGDTEIGQQVKEKKNINNKVKTSAMGGGIKLGEAVEEIGGTLLEMVEIDEVDFIVESVYGELLDEGYDENDIEEAIEYALTEAKVTLGHDTPSTEKKRESLLSVARKKLSGIKKSASAAVARGARKVAKGALGVARKLEGGDKKPSPAHTKTRTASTYRGAGAGTKEKVSSGSYTPPKKPEKSTSTKSAKSSVNLDNPRGSSTYSNTGHEKGDVSLKGPKRQKTQGTRPSDPWRGSYTKSSEVSGSGESNKPKPKPKAKAKPKATTKKTAAPKAKVPASPKKNKSKLDALLSDIRNENVQIDEKTLTKMEMEKREQIIQSMKDKKADFEKRYPGRGEEVMFATATKMAKRIAK